MLILMFTVILLGYFSVSTEACTTGDQDGTGVELLGTYYDCKYLRSYFPEDRFIGIYKHRKFHCSQPHTACCQTCQHIQSCKDAPADGIYLAESYYNCSFLQQYHPDDEKIGIYKNRKSICQQTTTDCCETCEKVFEETTKTVEAPTRPPTGTGQQTTEKVTPVEYKDTCIDNCLWIADGTSGQCNWLLDPTRTVYNIRHTLCGGFAPGCKRTCHIVAMESANTKPTEPKTEVTTTSTSVCVDSFMMVEKYSYACSDLLTPSSNIYNNRQTLCLSDSAACCVTCNRVLNEKSPGVIKYSDQNMIDKTGIVVESLPLTSDTNGYQNDRNIKVPSGPASKINVNPSSQTAPRRNVVSFYGSIKKSVDKLMEEEQNRRNMFTNLLTNIWTTFRKMQQTNN